MENKIIKNKEELITTEEIVKYLDLFQNTKNLTEIEKSQFVEIAKMSGLNPFKREIYISAYGEGKYRQCSIITGYEVYIKRAELSKLLNGWSTKIESCQSLHVSENGVTSFQKDIKAIIVIHRKDFDNPFVHEVKFSEYVQKTKQGVVNKFWKEKPETMLKKVAISQGFRMCFNEILGGMPYTKEELLNEEQTIDVNIQQFDKTKDNSELTKIREEAISSLPDCNSESDLVTLWDSIPELHKDKEWIACVKEAKKTIKELKSNK